ncbi:hypothetical protein [Gynuella sunshinyii]|uniref:Uncharacterized protein n=1 Tax=Gynuella sunshinyii YC6258 TaxID=1445510 RepID=A0A0C5VWS7_9GAMM|nr:hypothetical protein [Gynuella sunshinyii]AJQ94904.1 hypothetical Protein YC6258_02866 [Gynuella sunshinyii YC6258]
MNTVGGYSSQWSPYQLGTAIFRFYGDPPDGTTARKVRSIGERLMRTIMRLVWEPCITR